ncbi:MAG: shikimate dehydrogenase [Deinococcales bacterium]|nr:shikimate dehydrogenase [Deinococcales bacterium]
MGVKHVVLLAHPSGHSLSPVMQNSAFKALGLSARYEAVDVPPKDLPTIVEELRNPKFVGANVTVPHKVSVAKLVDELSQDASIVGAVNTVVRQGSKLVGHNTDGEGFLRGLADLNYEPAGDRVLLLGAGGAARAVAVSLLGRGVQSLSVYNRTLHKANDLVKDLSHLGPIKTLRLEEVNPELDRADLLVNATSVGMEKDGISDEEMPLPVGCFPKRGIVVDLVYRPERTRLLREAGKQGLVIQNGLSMLVYQGAGSIQKWFGQTPPTEEMFKAVLTALK